MPAQYYPLLKSGFQRKYSAKELLTIKGENGEDIDLIELILSLAEQMTGKLNIFLGAGNKQKILVTDAQGNITVVVGVVMQQEERKKLAELVKLASGIAIDIDQNNAINLKYDPLSLFINDKGELAFDIERITGGEVTKKEFLQLQGVTGNIQIQIDELKRWRYVEQVKDFSKYEGAVIGKIVQFDGESDTEYTNGHFYKYTLLSAEESAEYEATHAEYETVTVPSGSSVITYTNKYDGSIIKCFALNEPISVDNYTLPVEQYTTGVGGVWIISPSGERTRVQDVTALYTHDATLYSHLQSIRESHGDNIAGAKACYEYMMSHNYKAGFKVGDTPCIHGKIVDYVVSCYFTIQRHSNGEPIGTPGSINFYTTFSEMSKYSFDEKAMFEDLWFKTHTSPSYAFDLSADYIISDVGYAISHPYTDANDGNRYEISKGGGRGISGSKISEVIDEDGNTFYVPYGINGNSWSGGFLYENKPVGTKFSWAEMIDIKTFFDYTSEISTTTEDVIVRRRIRRYDEDGLPIKTIYAWRQHDTQPTPDQRSYWNEYY